MNNVYQVHTKINMHIPCERVRKYMYGKYEHVPVHIFPNPFIWNMHVIDTNIYIYYDNLGILLFRQSVASVRRILPKNFGRTFERNWEDVLGGQLKFSLITYKLLKCVSS